MKQDRMEELYSSIAGLLNELIPEPWSEIYLYAQLTDFMYTMYFFYYTKEKEKLVYSFDIPKNYEIDEDEFDDLKDDMKRIFKELRTEFVKNGQQPWTSLTMKVDGDGKLNIDYSYKDMSEVDPFEQQIIWRYEVLGIDSSNQGNRAKKVMEKYLKDKKQD